MPTDSGAFRSQFCGHEIVNAVLIVGGVAFEKAAHTTSHSARTPPERHAPASARAANDREPRSPLRAYWSVYELTHPAPGSRRAAGSRSTRTECPRICWHTIFYLWEPTAVGHAVETAWISASVRRIFIELLVPAGSLRYSIWLKESACHRGLDVPVTSTAADRLQDGPTPPVSP